MLTNVHSLRAFCGPCSLQVGTLGTMCWGFIFLVVSLFLFGFSYDTLR